MRGRLLLLKRKHKHAIASETPSPERPDGEIPDEYTIPDSVMLDVAAFDASKYVRPVKQPDRKMRARPPSEPTRKIRAEGSERHGGLASGTLVAPHEPPRQSDKYKIEALGRQVPVIRDKTDKPWTSIYALAIALELTKEQKESLMKHVRSLCYLLDVDIDLRVRPDGTIDSDHATAWIEEKLCLEESLGTRETNIIDADTAEAVTKWQLDKFVEDSNKASKDARKDEDSEEDESARVSDGEGSSSDSIFYDA